MGSSGFLLTNLVLFSNDFFFILSGSMPPSDQNASILEPISTSASVRCFCPGAKMLVSNLFKSGMKFLENRSSSVLAVFV